VAAIESGDSPVLQAGVGRNLGEQQDKHTNYVGNLWISAVFVCRSVGPVMYELDFSGTLRIDHQALKVDWNTST